MELIEYPVILSHWPPSWCREYCDEYQLRIMDLEVMDEIIEDKQYYRLTFVKDNV